MILSEDVAAKLKEYLSQSESWKSLSASQFVKHLALFVGWAVEDADWKVERAHQEGFLDSALNRSSILAHGESKEYMPSKPVPATGTAVVENTGTGTLTLPRGMEFQSDEQITYTLEGAVTVASGASVSASFSQRSTETELVEVDTTEAFHEILFSKEESRKIQSFKVEVSESGDESDFVEWTYDRLLVNSYSDDRVYDEFYHFTDQIGIRFGNGDFGRIPPQGSIVRITKIVTEGESMLLEGSSLWPVQEVTASDGTPAAYTVTVSETIENGSSQEGTEKTRRMLHYAPVYNERLVWENDYKYFLRRRFPDIVFAVAWGEEESEKMWGYKLENINQLWLCAYSPDRTTAETKAVVMEAVEDIPFLCRNFKWHDVEHLKFTVKITGKVLEDCVISEVVAAVKAKLEESYGAASESRRDEVLIHEIYGDIQDTGYFDRTTGSWFKVEISGSYSASYIYQMVSIDIENSTFSITY